jgi:hypothetical protein
MGRQRRVLLGMALAVVGLLGLVTSNYVQSQPPAEAAKPAKTVPAGQTYTGAKACSSCHFKQFMAWKKSKHATAAFESVPAKYKADPKCVNCHATGYGAPTGFKSATATPNLTGTSCEACHGPGSKHAEIAKKYATKKTLAPAEEAEVRGSIELVQVQNVCIRCHITQGHKEHPPYQK